MGGGEVRDSERGVYFFKECKTRKDGRIQMQEYNTRARS